MRDRSPAELTAWLLSRGYPEEEASLAVSRLVAGGLVSESRAAEAAVRRRSGRAAVGDERLIAELEGIGVDASSVALGDELDRARAALVGREGDPAKLAGFLARRGFSEETVRAVVPGAFPDEE